MDKPLLSRLDLNLLVSLDALLTERSVTKAAEKLHLSQPALSASLSRLRSHFNDPILARRGNAYELTPFALRLIDHTTTALQSARRVFESQVNWEPAGSTREFTIYGSDYGFATAGALVSRLARERAPGVRFRFVRHGPAIVQDASTRLRSVDAMMLPHGFLSDLPFRDLWNDDWVILADASNPHVTDGVSMDHLGSLPWVFTYQSREAFTAASRQLQHLGIEPRVEAVVESFVALGSFVIGTDRLALVQRSLLAPLVRALPLRGHDLPFGAAPIVNALWWHPIHDRDPEHEWMRELIAEATARLQPEVDADARPPGEG